MAWRRFFATFNEKIAVINVRMCFVVVEFSMKQAVITANQKQRKIVPLKLN